MALTVFIPYDFLLYFINPMALYIVFTSLKLSSISIWQFAVFKSIFVKMLIPASEWNATSTLDIEYESEKILWFTPIL